MPRVIDADRRDDVLAKAVDYVLEQGVSSISVRPVAMHAGCSPERLLAWFGGTRDRLVETIVNEAQRRQHEALLEWFAAGTPGDLAALLRRYWQWACEPQHQAYLRLFFEVYALSLQTPDRYPALRDGPLGRWRTVVEDLAQKGGVDPGSAEGLATRVVATVFGLLLDLLTTGDLERTTRALDAFAAELSHQSEAAR